MENPITGAVRAFAALWTSLADLVCCPVCFACGCGVAQGHERGLEREPLCPSCRSQLVLVPADDPVANLTRERLMQGGAISGLIVRYFFRPGTPIQTLVHEVKYRGTAGLGLALGRDLAVSVTEALSAGSTNLPVCGLIAVPLHHAKLRDRGYNQSDYIARGISRATGIPVLPGIVVRHRATRSQTALNVAGRAANVAGAFRVRPAAAGRIRGQRLILVDDVVTSGATLASCARALRSAGAGEVIACALALAP